MLARIEWSNTGTWTALSCCWSCRLIMGRSGPWLYLHMGTSLSQVCVQVMASLRTGILCSSIDGLAVLLTGVAQACSHFRQSSGLVCDDMGNSIVTASSVLNSESGCLACVVTCVMNLLCGTPIGQLMTLSNAKFSQATVCCSM